MRRAYLWVVAALALGWVAGPAAANSTLVFQAVPVPTANGKGVVGRVFVSDELVMTLPGAGQESLDAAEEMARRLNALAEAGLKAREITVSRAARTRTLLARGERLIVIDRVTAKAFGMSVDRLATRWQTNLRAQFGRPYLSMEPTLIPLGEDRVTPVLGNLAGAVKLDADNGNVALAWDNREKAVRISGRQVGRALLTVSNAGATLQLPVRVAKYAAQLSGPLTAVVTGNPPTADTVQAAVESTLDSCLQMEPGTQSDVTTLLNGVTPPSPGRSASVPVSISVEGEDYLPFRVRPVVVVANQLVDLAPVSLLMVSNSPERLVTHGLWFEGPVSEQQPVRLLYHHVNSTRASASLSVELWNLGTEPARVHLIAGIGGPSFDEAWVGHIAAADFLRSRVRGAGWVVQVPPGMAVTPIAQLLPASAIGSGLLELRALNSANVSVRVYLKTAGPSCAPRPVDRYEPSPLLGQWQYPDPRREVKASYRVGGAWTFITIGDQPAVGVVDGDRLQGSYGVMYEVSLELTNPTTSPAQVQLMLESAGGPARGALLVDGRVMEVAMVRKTEEAAIAVYPLAPGETRTVRISTMPQSGSNYPVRLVARPL